MWNATEIWNKKRIFQIFGCDKKKYLTLLLLADEQENMIDRYLERGNMFVFEADAQVCAVCVVTDEGDGTLEIKNLAVVPEKQKRGYGRQMIEFIAGCYAKDYHTLLVGTGDSPLTIPFYERCGFVRSHIVEDFFTEHYDHPIIEDGVLLRDMIYLKRKIG